MKAYWETAEEEDSERILITFLMSLDKRLQKENSKRQIVGVVSKESASS